MMPRHWPDREQDDPIVEAVGTAIADWWSGDFYDSAKAALSTPVVTQAFRDAVVLAAIREAMENVSLKAPMSWMDVAALHGAVRTVAALLAAGADIGGDDA